MGKFQTLSEILIGWKNATFKNPIIEQMATKRLTICFNCEHKTAKNTCGLCGCHLVAKTRSPESDCPDNKW